MKFGVARKYGPDLIRYIPKLHLQNVDAFEIGYAYGTRPLTEEIKIVAEEEGVSLSGHLPFWINLGNIAATEKNVKYLVDGIRLANSMKSIVVFHLGFYGQNEFNKILGNIIQCFMLAFEEIELTDGVLGLETTGKQKAIGTIEEIVTIVNKLGKSNVLPIIDWSHLFARSNGAIASTLKSVEDVLGYFEDNCLNRLRYFHGGSIEYKDGNEIRHISALACRPSMPIILEALYKKGYGDSTIIIESPDSINDINWLKNKL